MKILMVLDHEFPPDVRVYNEATALISAGHKVHIACFTQKGLVDYELWEGIHIHRVPISSLMFKLSVAALTLPFYFRFWYQFLDALFRKYHFEAIHIHDLPLSKVGVKLSKKYNARLTIDLHENWPAFLRVSTHTNTFLGKILSPNRLWERYEKEVLKQAHAVIVVVDEAKERVAGLGVEWDNIFLVSNTLNIDEFEVSADTPDPNFYTLYYAGGINFHRGLQTVIEAVARVKDRVPNLRFRIAGFGSYQSNLEELADKLGVGDRVEFLGYLPLKDVARNLWQADAALIPHLKTDHTDSTIPHKLFQYMYINKPIIASNCAPIQRIVEETGSGVIFRSEDVNHLAEQIIGLVEGDYHIKPAKHWVEQKYNWNYDLQLLLKCYA